MATKATDKKKSSGTTKKKIDSTHKLYDRNEPFWKKCRVVAYGEEAVKGLGVAFLPKLTGQTEDEYNGYKGRAMFYGATGRTIQGLHGAIFRKPLHVQNANDKIKERLKTITPGNEPLDSLAREAGRELLTVGRGGFLVDAPEEENGKPFINMYKAEAIYNWRGKQTDTGFVLTLVVLRVVKSVIDEKDEFVEKDQVYYRVLMLENGVYKQELWKEQNKAAGVADKTFIRESETYPKITGKTLDFIPFHFIGAESNAPDAICLPPLLALVNVNLSHYRNSADLEHGRHFCGLPTPYAAGFELETDDQGRKETLKIGSEVAWVSEDPQAKANYLEFTGQGLSSLEKALEEKQALMAILGARMLEEAKAGVEAEGTQRLRRAGESNALSAIGTSLGAALTTVVNWWAKWSSPGTGEPNIVVDVNDDFLDFRLTPQELTALMQAYQGGGISWDTLFYNLQRGEMLPPDADPEVEKTKVDQGSLSLGGGAKGLIEPEPTKPKGEEDDEE